MLSLLADQSSFLSTIPSTQGSGSGISLYADKEFDDAYNTTLIENDLPHLRWGRIDYMNVTYITTKWAVWKCVVILRIPSNADRRAVYLC